MKRWLVAGMLALAPSLGMSQAQDPAANGSKPAPDPFYRKYLVAGNRLDEEILAMEKRIEEAPDDANLHNDFGNLLALRQFPEQAAEQYELAARLDAANFISLYNLGLLRETEGKPSSAISAYKKSIARKPGFPPSRFRLGRLYEKSGKLDDAVTQYAKAFWIDPSMRDPRRNPLVIDSDLTYRASIANYERDLARASLDRDVAFQEEPAFRRVPVDRAVESAEIAESEAEPAPREIGPGTGAPAGGGAARKPRATPPADAPMLPRQRPTATRPVRGTRPPPPAAVTPAPAEEEIFDPMSPENVPPPPEADPTPGPPDEDEPS